jgi:hypothetical protein
MKDRTKQNITLKIADVLPMSITIDREAEEVAREAERGVNSVWNAWRKSFTNKTSKEVLAMTAYQFAKLYFALQHSVENQEQILDDFEGELDRLLQLTAESEDINNKAIN